MIEPLRLSGPGLRPQGAVSAAPFIGRVCAEPGDGPVERERAILLVRGAAAVLPSGFRAYLLDGEVPSCNLRDVYCLAPHQRFLADGDVVRIDPARRTLTVLYRKASRSNSFLVTERCDNFCRMCSQPPRTVVDDWLVDELLELIPLVSPETEEIGITGGEPAVLGARLVEIVARMKLHLPRTALHVLTNGRRFADASFSRALAAVEHPDLMMGIPLYSDLPEDHDFVVQAFGAFDETVRGIINLKRDRLRVELRFVIQADTYLRLPEFAYFVARNLRFVDHVALMGLELMGFARANLDSLWIDPLDYQKQLTAAVRTLDSAGMRVSIYNHALCVLPPELLGYALQSISDWKQVFFDECSKCTRKPDCGGFFASATLRRSRGIRAL